MDSLLLLSPENFLKNDSRKLKPDCSHESSLSLSLSLSIYIYIDSEITGVDLLLDVGPGDPTGAIVSFGCRSKN